MQVRKLRWDFRLPTSDFRLRTSDAAFPTSDFWSRQSPKSEVRSRKSLLGFSNLGNPFLRIICLSVSLTGSKDILLNHEETCFDLEELEMSSPRILVSGFPDKTSKIALIIYFQFYVLFNASWGQYEKCIRISGNYRNWALGKRTYVNIWKVSAEKGFA